MTQPGFFLNYPTSEVHLKMKFGTDIAKKVGLNKKMHFNPTFFAISVPNFIFKMKKKRFFKENCYKFIQLGTEA